jgi:hypothetical protein
MVAKRSWAVSFSLALVSVVASVPDVRAGDFLVKVYAASTGTTLITNEELRLTARDSSGAVIPIGGANSLSTTTGIFRSDGSFFTVTPPAGTNKTVQFEIRGVTSGNQIAIENLNGGSTVPQKIFATFP